MKKLRYILVFTCAFYLLSCGSTKTKSTTATKTIVKEVLKNTVKELTVIEKKHFGDTLKGKVFLPKLTKKPTVLTFESGGAKLDIVLTENTLEYKATTKHIATTKTHKVKTMNSDKVVDAVQIKEVKEVELKTPWRPPWWLYITAIVVLYYIFKPYLSPIKTIFKTTFKTIFKL